MQDKISWFWELSALYTQHRENRWRPDNTVPAPEALIVAEKIPQYVKWEYLQAKI